MRHLKLALLFALICAPALAVTTVTYEDTFTPLGERFRTIKFAVPTTETSDPFYVERYDTIAVIPTTSCTAQFTVSPKAEVIAATATWITWAPGTVTAATSRVLEGRVTAIRFTATSGACVGLVARR